MQGRGLDVLGLYRGLIGAGDRKSVQPMAARDDEVGYDQLHRRPTFGIAPLERTPLAETDRLDGGANAWMTV
jgi:hypothetical protein